MSPPKGPAPVLSTRVLNRTLLDRQLLLERVERPIPETLEHLVGLQAQVPSSPYIALRARLVGFDPADLEQLFLDRRVVRMVLMRATIHLVTVDDALRLRPVVQPVLDWELFRNRTWSVGLEGVDLGPVLALGRELVNERPRAMDELRAAMAERFPGREAGTLAYAVRNQLPTFQAPPRGLWTRSGAVRLAAVDSWSGRPMATDTAPDRMILRYLAAFGPASTSDVASWSRLTGLREPMERLRRRLRTYRDERGRELFDVPDAPIADPDVPAPVRFLPDYDNLLLGHDDRTRVIPAPVMAQVRQRIGGPTFLVDGFVAGFWRLARAGGASEITLEPLRPLTDPERDAVEAEARTLLPFLDTAGPRRAPGREDQGERAQRARVRWLA